MSGFTRRQYAYLKIKGKPANPEKFDRFDYEEFIEEQEKEFLRYENNRKLKGIEKHIALDNFLWSIANSMQGRKKRSKDLSRSHSGG